MMESQGGQKNQPFDFKYRIAADHQNRPLLSTNLVSPGLLSILLTSILQPVHIIFLCTSPAPSNSSKMVPFTFRTRSKLQTIGHKWRRQAYCELEASIRISKDAFFE